MKCCLRMGIYRFLMNSISAEWYGLVSNLLEWNMNIDDKVMLEIGQSNLMEEKIQAFRIEIESLVQLYSHPDVDDAVLI